MQAHFILVAQTVFENSSLPHKASAQQCGAESDGVCGVLAWELGLSVHGSWSTETLGGLGCLLPRKGQPCYGVAVKRPHALKALWPVWPCSEEGPLGGDWLTRALTQEWINP